MKFIHTADWHLGNKMHDIDRTTEFQSFLTWLHDEIIAKNAETLVVSGDIYDSANPPVESRRQYINFLASLQGTCCKNVVVVGGNHDSGMLLDSEKEILDLLNIHVVGSVGNKKAEEMVFELYDKNGDVNGICCAVPFAREAELRAFCDSDNSDGTFSDRANSALYKNVLKAAEKLRSGKNIPIIATGHLYAANLEGRLANLNHEEDADDGVRKLDVVGNLGLVHAAVFPEEFDYVALGHIHYSTKVGGKSRIRYSGSPFVLGFDEASLPRNVLLVDSEKNEEPSIEKIEVPRFANYRRISGSANEIISEIKNYIIKAKKSENGKLLFADGKNTYIEISYKSEDAMNVHEKVDELIPSLPENVHIVSRRLMQAENQMLRSYDYDTAEIGNLSSEEIFKALILSKNPIDMSLSEDEAEKKKQELFDIYIPMLKEIENEVEMNQNEE